MLDKMRAWLDKIQNRGEILNRLTSDAVRQHRNVRPGDTSAQGGHVHNAMLPEGGLQAVVASHNIHVVSWLCITEGKLTVARCTYFERCSRSYGRQNGKLPV
jgi:hypothetical protein